MIVASEVEMAPLRALYLFAALGFFAIGIALSRVAVNPSDASFGRWMLRALDSWYLRARWSASPEDRLRRMVWSAFILAVAMLALFIINPPPRY